MQLAEFFGKIGFKISEDEKKKLKDFDDGMKGLATSFGVVAAAGAGALYAIDKLIGNATRGAAALNNFQIQTGQSAQKVQQFDMVLQLADLNAQAGDSIQIFTKLSSAISQLAWKGENNNLFRMLGVQDFNTDASGIMKQMADYYNNVHPPAQWYSNRLQELGLPANIVTAFAKWDEISKKLKEHGIVPLTKEENDRLVDLGTDFKTLTLQWDTWVKHLLADKDVNDVLKEIIKLLGEVAHTIQVVASEVGHILDELGIKDQVKHMVALAFVAGTLGTALVGASKAFRLLTGAMGGRGLIAAEGAILGLTRSLGGMLLMLSAVLYVLEHYKDIKDYFDKNPDTITAKYNPFYYAGAEAVRMIYGKDSPEYKAVVKKTAGMWGKEYDDGSADKALEDKRLAAWKDYKAGKRTSYADKTSVGGSPGAMPLAIDDPAHQDDLGKLAYHNNVSEDPRPDFPDFKLKNPNGTPKVLAGSGDNEYLTMPPSKESIAHMNMTQTNQVSVNVHGGGDGTDYKAAGNLIAGQIGLKTSNMLIDAHDQLNNGGF